MKRVLSVIVLSLIPLLAFSQLQMKIAGNVEWIPNDTDARNFQVTDDNDDKCALIKVSLTNPVSSTLVVDTKGSLNPVASPTGSNEQPNGEWWFWLSPRVTNIKFMCKGYKETGYIGVSLSEGRVYRINLEVEADYMNRIYDSSKKQKLILQVYPENARIEINGMTRKPGRNGIYEEDEVSFGVYDVVVSADKYHTRRTQIVINDPQKPQRFNIHLSQAFGWLNIPGDGDESVSIDGQSLSFTPGKNMGVKSGQYKLIIRKPYYKPFEQSVVIKDSIVTKVNPQFIPNFKEFELRVSNDAEIWIDNTYKGKGKWQGRLEYRSHSIECRKTSHRTSYKSLDVNPNTENFIQLDSPTPLYGYVNVASNPSGAEVYVDGRKQGTTPFRQQYLIGRHQVKITKNGYQDFEESVTVEEERTVNVETRLDNLFPVSITVQPSGNTNIYIDGKYAQVSPWFGTLRSGKHKIRIESPHHKSIERSIDVKEPNTKYYFKLRRLFYELDHTGSFLGVKSIYDLNSINVGGYAGLRFKHLEVEANFQYDFTPETIYWNLTQIGSEPLRYEYNTYMFGGRLGYGMVLGTRMMFTPSIGFYYLMMEGEPDDYSLFYDPLSPGYGLNAFAGAKLSIAIAPHVEFSVSPEYATCLYKSALYQSIYDVSPKVQSRTEGFRLAINIGLYF